MDGLFVTFYSSCHKIPAALPSGKANASEIPILDESKYAELQQRYVALFGNEPASSTEIAQVEHSLDVVLPHDIKAIANFYRGGILGCISHYEFSGETTNAYTIAATTLSFRSTIGLPHRFIVLAEPGESTIVLDTESDVVIWCDNPDVSSLEDISQMISAPDTWPSYASFFEYLLNEETEERGE